MELHKIEIKVQENGRKGSKNVKTEREKEKTKRRPQARVKGQTKGNGDKATIMKKGDIAKGRRE